MGAIAGISGWRGAVILASTIGFLSTLLSFSILEEPVRPRKEWGKSGILMALREKSVLLLLAASLVSLIAYRGIAAFASLYVVEGKGQTVEEALSEPRAQESQQTEDPRLVLIESWT
jgi:predicted MFS family arabinose efflux permease